MRLCVLLLLHLDAWWATDVSVYVLTTWQTQEGSPKWKLQCRVSGPQLPGFLLPVHTQLKLWVLGTDKFLQVMIFANSLWEKGGNVNTDAIYTWRCTFGILFSRFYFIFGQGQGGRESERKRHHYVVDSHAPLLGTWPTTHTCALYGNWTGGLLVCRSTLNPLNHASQGRFWSFQKQFCSC